MYSVEALNQITTLCKLPMGSYRVQRMGWGGGGGNFGHSAYTYASDSLGQLFEGRLALNPGFFFLRSKAFSRIIFSVIFRASNHKLVDKNN